MPPNRLDGVTDSACSWTCKPQPDGRARLGDDRVRQQTSGVSSLSDDPALAGRHGPDQRRGRGMSHCRSAPGAIETAGIILLMAMLGAAVLGARRSNSTRRLRPSAHRDARRRARDEPFHARPHVGPGRLARAAAPGDAHALPGGELRSFVIGSSVSSRRNLIIMFLCTELMFQAAGCR